MLPPPFQRVAVSADSDYLARVDPGRWLEAEKRRSPDWVSIHHYDVSKRQFIKVSQFQLSEHPGSGFLFISNGGKHIVAVNVGAWIGFEKLGLRIYDQKGKLLRAWRLEDFLTPEEIEGCAKTGSTLQWFQSGAFSSDGKKFEFSGPASHIAGWGSSFTVMQGAKEGLSFRFSLDVPTLALTRD
jgi:hypothetical protein